MQLKLVEAVKPISRVEGHINRYIIPALERIGYEFQLGRTLKEKFINTYQGTYTNKEGLEAPFTLELNTASPKIDEKFHDLFASMTIADEKADIGSFNSKDPKTFTTLISYSMPNIDQLVREYNNVYEEPETTDEDVSSKRAAQADMMRASILNQPKEVAPTEVKQAKVVQEKPKTKPSPEIIKIGKKIEEILASFGITVKYEDVTVGPAITQYEFSLKSGTKISEVTSLHKEICMGLAVNKVSIGPVEGKTTVGVQVPNTEVKNVSLDEVLEDNEDSGVSVALGKDLNGNAISGDILKMQHVLIGGTTGSGKSSCINGMICSLIQKYSPDQVKLILIDPKKVELSAYSSVPHLLMPIVTDPKKADSVLSDMVKEMDNRYDIFKDYKVKNIEGYNNLVLAYSKNHPNEVELMPYIVIIIDELADLMMTAGKSVESSIQRITQLARAAGIHLIVATQRPSADIVTGVIKSNIASRISFATSSNTDSRVILDQPGAEKLLGKGDMLFKPSGESNPKRIQGVYVSDDEVASIVDKVNEKYK